MVKVTLDLSPMGLGKEYGRGTDTMDHVEPMRR